jgi:hypothetical protein
VSALSISVLDMFPEPYAAAPQLTARLRLTGSADTVVHAVALRAQVRIEPQRRPHSRAEELGLTDLFGPRERWHDTLRPFLWMQTGAMVPGFTGVTETDLPLPCTYDFDVAAAKYLHALRDGVISLVLLFSGSVFTRTGAGFGVEPISWDLEARHELPVAVWRELIHHHFPNTGWLRLDHEVIARLAAYRAEHGLTSWEDAVRSLLPDSARTTP